MLVSQLFIHVKGTGLEELANVNCLWKESLSNNSGGNINNDSDWIKGIFSYDIHDVCSDNSIWLSAWISGSPAKLMETIDSEALIRNLENALTR